MRSYGRWLAIERCECRVSRNKRVATMTPPIEIVWPSVDLLLTIPNAFTNTEQRFRHHRTAREARFCRGRRRCYEAYLSGAGWAKGAPPRSEEFCLDTLSSASS